MLTRDMRRARCRGGVSLGSRWRPALLGRRARCGVPLESRCGLELSDMLGRLEEVLFSAKLGRREDERASTAKLGRRDGTSPREKDDDSSAISESFG